MTATPIPIPPARPTPIPLEDIFSGVGQVIGDLGGSMVNEITTSITAIPTVNFRPDIPARESLETIDVLEGVTQVVIDLGGAILKGIGGAIIKEPMIAIGFIGLCIVAYIIGRIRRAIFG
jgi:hypothetical protein